MKRVKIWFDEKDGKLKRVPDKIKLPGKGVYYNVEILSSFAYQSLNGTAIKVLNIFFLKRNLIDKRSKRKHNIDPCSADIVRDNNITFFRYNETVRYGINNKSTFTNAIDSLINVGFINIKVKGNIHKSTIYELSDRWMKYCTSEFKVNKRKRRKLFAKEKEEFNSMMQRGKVKSS